MSIDRFQVSTRRTGLLRVVPVEVHHDADEFASVYRRRWAPLTRDSDPTDVAGSVIPVKTWADRDPRPVICRLMLLALEQNAMPISLVIHEATHVAMHIYSVDGYRDNAKASAHLRGANEAIPYIVTDIAVSIAKRLQRLGFDVHTDDPKRYGPYTLPEPRTAGSSMPKESP